MTIGNRVLELLAQKGLKQKDLADFLGTKPSTINGWKSENRNPSSDLILPICEFLNVSCEFLLSGDEKNIETTTTNNEEIFSLIEKLSVDKQNELKGYIKRMLEESVAAGSDKKAVGK